MHQATQPGGAMWGLKEFVIRLHNLQRKIVARHKSLSKSTTLFIADANQSWLCSFLFTYFCCLQKSWKVKLDLKGSWGCYLIAGTELWIQLSHGLDVLQ